VSKLQLEKDLTKELIFLSAYRRQREGEVARYIHEHIEELVERAHRMGRGHFFLGY
jgi:hypothetical protein